MSQLTITTVGLSAGEGTSFTRCALCKEGAKDADVLRFAVTAEVREGKGHDGMFYLHPKCFLSNLPALWAATKFISAVDEVLEPMASAIRKEDQS